MRGGRPRGRSGRGLLPIRPLSSLTSLSLTALLRGDAVEVRDPAAAAALYAAGFYGRGTVSRRAPNDGAFEVLVAADADGAAAAAEATAAATGEAASASAAALPSSKRARSAPAGGAAAAAAAAGRRRRVTS